jgi:catechol 2,3-dioxygenase-like lactoylglutathione lyase family enzyme
MTLRYARHTSNLEKIEKFYTDIVGLERLGGFENHNNYHGIFLGQNNCDWHLEFTISGDQPKSIFDEDDILVFYVNSEKDMWNIRERLIENNMELEIPKNPYWRQNGIMISDPDGYKVIFSIKWK